MNNSFGWGIPPLPNSNMNNSVPYPNQSNPYPHPTQQNPNMNSYPGQPNPCPMQQYPNVNSYPGQPNPCPMQQYPNVNSYPGQPNPYPTQQSGGYGLPPPSNPNSMPSGYPPNSTTAYTQQSYNPCNSNSRPQQGYYREKDYEEEEEEDEEEDYSESDSEEEDYSESDSEEEDDSESDYEEGSPSSSIGNPTVFPYEDFDPDADAESLTEAMKGWGSKKEVLIDIICNRSNEQRQEIQRVYNSINKKDLITKIKSETGGNLKNLLVALLKPTATFYAEELHDAIAGAGTNEDVLIEVLCSLTNDEIRTIKQRYKEKYRKTLESAIKSETSSDFKRLLTSLCGARRDESGVVDQDAASEDATALFKAGEKRLGTDESKFHEIFCRRNYAQLKLICETYQDGGSTMEEAIKNEFSGDIKNGLLAILQCTTDKADYFASLLRNSLEGMGTNDKQLIRLIVTRCEVDLQDIKDTFDASNKNSLASWIKGDTSGDYKRALLVLCGES